MWKCENVEMWKCENGYQENRMIKSWFRLIVRNVEVSDTTGDAMKNDSW